MPKVLSRAWKFFDVYGSRAILVVIHAAIVMLCHVAALGEMVNGRFWDAVQLEALAFFIGVMALGTFWLITKVHNFIDNLFAH